MPHNFDIPSQGRPLCKVRSTASQREGASTVSLNHPLKARSTGAWSNNNA